MKCLQCEEEMSEECDTCTECGWTYKEQQGIKDLNPQEQLLCTRCLTPYEIGQVHCEQCNQIVNKYMNLTGLH